MMKTNEREKRLSMRIQIVNFLLTLLSLVLHILLRMYLSLLSLWKDFVALLALHHHVYLLYYQGKLSQNIHWVVFCHPISHIIFLTSRVDLRHYARIKVHKKQMMRRAFSLGLRKIFPVNSCNIVQFVPIKLSCDFLLHILIMWWFLCYPKIPLHIFSSLRSFHRNTKIFHLQVPENHENKFVWRYKFYLSDCLCQNSYKIQIKLSLMSPMTIHQIMFLLIFALSISAFEVWIWTFMLTRARRRRYFMNFDSEILLLSDFIFSFFFFHEEYIKSWWRQCALSYDDNTTQYSCLRWCGFMFAEISW